MKVLGAHMLEVCPTIADGRPCLEIHPLSIGGKADPARLVFNTRPGPALNASLLDMGNRFRLVVNEVDVVATRRAAAETASSARIVGTAAPILKLLPPPGFTLAAHIIPVSASHSRLSILPILPTLPVSNAC